MKPVVIVPTYNERDNIDILLDELMALPVTCERDQRRR